MRRREFVTLIGVAAAWPLAARAQQQPERMRRIGVLMNLAADDSESPVRIAVFLQGLQQLGWTDGRNVRIDYRWGAYDAEHSRRYAGELIALAPDVILASGSLAVTSLQQLTSTVPIVFVSVVDPVGSGFVASLARPGGNITGFMLFEHSLSGKWLELLKQIAPRVTRVAVVRDPAIASGGEQLSAIESVAPSLGVELRPVSMHNTTEIERTIAEFARGPGGLIVTGSTLGTLYRERIIALANSPPVARGLLLPLFRHRGRPDLLWARFP